MTQVERLLWVGLAGAGLVIGVLALRSYWNERVDRIQLDAELKATQRLLQAKDEENVRLNQQNSRLDQGMKDRDQQTAEMVKEIERLKARPATIREIVHEVPQYIPFEKPPELVPSNPAAPEAPAQIGLDESQSQDLRKFYLDCHRATLSLQACQEDATDWRAKETVWQQKEITWQEKEAILVQQREAAVNAVKGGTFWTRFKRNGGWYAAGGLTGGVIVAIFKR